MTEPDTSTGPRLAPIRPIGRSERTASLIPPPPSKPSQPLSRLPRIGETTRRTLDFDTESVAAGFADPQWVPQTVTCWAYSWVDGDEVQVSALPVSDFYDLDARRGFLGPLLDAIEQADVVTGHNLVRHDLPLLNAQCLLLGLPTLRPVLVQDTMKFPRSKGWKKGQDNVSHALSVVEEKRSLNWAEWQAAYAEPDLATVKDRCASDVLMHKRMREAMRERGWLKPPRPWTP